MTQNKEKNIHRLTVDVAMDENMIPEEIIWKSNDEKNASEEKAAAALIYFWNKNQNETFNLDLWTKEMPVDEMDEFFYQSILTMSEAYFKATENNKIKDALKKFSKSLEKNLNVNKNNNKRS